MGWSCDQNCDRGVQGVREGGDRGQRAANLGKIVPRIPSIDAEVWMRSAHRIRRGRQFGDPPLAWIRSVVSTGWHYGSIA